MCKPRGSIANDPDWLQIPAISDVEGKHCDGRKRSKDQKGWEDCWRTLLSAEKPNESGEVAYTCDFLPLLSLTWSICLFPYSCGTVISLLLPSHASLHALPNHYCDPCFSPSWKTRLSSFAINMEFEFRSYHITWKYLSILKDFFKNILNKLINNIDKWYVYKWLFVINIKNIEILFKETIFINNI